MERNIYSKIKVNKNLNNYRKLIFQQKLRKDRANFYHTPTSNKINFNRNLSINTNKSNISNIYTDNNIIKLKNEYNNIPDLMESSLSTKIYEKNITLLNDRIKEQEKNNLYLSKRLKNYDMTINEITKLNIEVNKLNEIIRDKNNTIQEFRNITDMSKHKIEELIKSKNELIQKVMFLEEENNNLKNLYKNNNINKYNNNTNKRNNYHNNSKIKNYDNMKNDLKQIIKENNDLKLQINKKNDTIKNLKDIIEKLKKEKNNEKINNTNLSHNKDTKYNNDLNLNNIDYTKNNNIDFKNLYNKNEKDLKEPLNKYDNNWKLINSLTKKKYIMQKRSPTPLVRNFFNDKFEFYKKKNYNIDSSHRTEPNSTINIKSSYSKNVKDFKNKYNYLKHKYNIEPLDYSNYLLNNLQTNIDKNYN